MTIGRAVALAIATSLIGGCGVDRGDVCADYDNETGSGEVKLRIVNDSPAEIYIPKGCSGGTFELLGADGQQWDKGLSCELSCVELRDSNQQQCGVCASTVAQLAPGGTLELSWAGTGVVSRNMPDRCSLVPSEGDSCRQVVAAPAQTYQVEVPASAECEVMGGGSCQCADGTCQGGRAGAKVTHEPAAFAYPEEKTVDVVFGACAFGCADGDR